MASALLDEHGQSDGEVPGFVTPDTLERWLACAIIATYYTRQPAGDPENTMFATTLFESPAELGEIDVEEFGPTTIIQEARAWREAWVRRNRLGEFAEKPDLPRIRIPAPPSSPGTHYTPEQISAAGLDRWPSKGKAAKALLGKAKNTAELYADAEPASPGTLRKVPYSAERTEKHNEIIASFLKGKTPPEMRPHAVFTAGGPASGKSTMLEHNPGLLPPEENTVHIDPDKIKDLLPEYQELRAAKDRYAASAVHQESGDIATRLMFEAMEQGFHVVIDGTGDSDPGSFTKQLQVARDRHYTVDVIYVNAPTDTAVSYAIKRAEEQGRFVPIPVVREQHTKVSRNFVNEVAGLDWLERLDIFDQGSHIAAMRNGALQILDPARFAAFVDKQKEQDG